MNIVDYLLKKVEVLVVWLAGVGAVIILIQIVWISYGVFVRYVLGSPDRMVTEATALLLFPVAFTGLAYAMREDAYPKVNMITDFFSIKVQHYINITNYILMLGVGLFFTYTGISATIRSFNSGASSEILHWPRYIFWTPGALALSLFSLYTALRLIKIISNSTHQKD